jgi:CheY-like chemotaxis protein
MNARFKPLLCIGAVTQVMEHLALVVEDEKPLRTIYEMVLKDIGFKIIHATDGQQAIEVLQETTPDIVFLDMLLPRVNGTTVLDYLHTAPHLQNTHVVVVTAHDRFSHAGLLRSQDEFLLKPIHPKDLRNAAQRFMAET